MSAAAPAIEITRLPGERGEPGEVPLLACGGCGCCCCCCCCLHSVGGVLGALSAGIGDPVLPQTRRGAGAHHPGGPAPALAAEARRVLGAFALFRAAEQLREAGHLVSQRFEQVAELARLRAQQVWDELYPSGRPAAVSWLLQRLQLMSQHDILPEAALPHFRRVLAGQVGEQAGAPVARGPLAHLWRLHVLYQEIQAAVAAEVVSPRCLGDVRRHLFDQVLQVARDLDAYEGDAAAGRFTGEVLDEARGLLEQLGRGTGALRGADLEGMRGQLEGRHRPTPAAVEGACKVCGDALRAFALVHCGACETPVHQSCWEYNGRCPTFACGCASPREELAGPDAPLRFDLSEGPEREQESWPGARAVAHYWGWFTVVVACSLVLGPWVALFLAPALQLVAAVLAALTLGATPEEGREQARTQLARIAVRGFTGACWGVLGMVLAGVGFLVFSR